MAEEYAIVFMYHIFIHPSVDRQFRLFLNGKESACNLGDASSVPGLGRSSGGGNGKPLQYSCLGNPMDRGAWQATVYGVTKNPRRLST